MRKKKVRLKLKLIVGLGNKGAEYQDTRHNIGFMVVDYLADKYRSTWSESKNMQITKISLEDFGITYDDIFLMKPLTYMNLSGKALKEWLYSHKEILYSDDVLTKENLSYYNICIIYDDFSLPFGRLRLRSKGSSGGHNGIKSIIDSIGSIDIPRLRVGIGSVPNGWSLTDHVLGSFHKDELEDLQQIIQKASNAAEIFVKTKNISLAMQTVNQTEN